MCDGIGMVKEKRREELKGGETQTKTDGERARVSEKWVYINPDPVL